MQLMAISVTKGDSIDEGGLIVYKFVVGPHTTTELGRLKVQSCWRDSALVVRDNDLQLL